MGVRQKQKKLRVREMGDPVEVGLGMDRIHWPTMAGMIAPDCWPSLAGLSFFYEVLWYQTVLGIEQSERRTEELFGTGMSSSWHTSLELPGTLLGLLMIGICYMDYMRIAVYAKPILVAYQVLHFSLTAGRRCEK